MRIGGAGLGNLLFMYSRALVFAKENGCSFIWPIWKSIKVGPWLRNEKDKRFYADLFKNNSGYIDGREKRRVLRKCRTITPDEFDPNADGQIVVFDKYIFGFSVFDGYRDRIREELVKNLHPKNTPALEYDFSNSVSIHLRLGDFDRGNAGNLNAFTNNISTPVSWYADIVQGIRSLLGYNIKVYLFSDGGDDELKALLDMSNVERISFGTSIADIMALSRAELLIASGSTFSCWARFLGGVSALAYPTQMKEFGLCRDGGFEYEVGSVDELSDDKKQAIKKVFERYI